MARNSAGTMSAPGSYPPAPDSIIDLDAYKALVQDIINEITDSLSRSGKGGLLAPLKLVDGTASLPGVSFISEPSSGLSRYGAGDLRFSILGNAIAKVLATGVEVTGLVKASGAVEAGTTVKATGGLADDATHGARGGGTQHAEATTGAAGFLSAADKAKLDGLHVGAFVAPVASALVTGGSWAVDGMTVSHTQTGVYNFTFTTPQSDLGYHIQVTPTYGANWPLPWVDNKSVNGFTVKTYNGTSLGNLVDAIFDVVVTRHA